MNKNNPEQPRRIPVDFDSWLKDVSALPIIPLPTTLSEYKDFVPPNSMRPIANPVNSCEQDCNALSAAAAKLLYLLTHTCKAGPERTVLYDEIVDAVINAQRLRKSQERSENDK